jgi:hypothetical protein
MQASGNAIEAGLPLLKKYYKEFMLKRQLATASAAGSNSSGSGSANAASSTAVVPIKSVTAPGTAAGAAANSGTTNSTAGTGAATTAATSKGAWPVAAAVSASQHGAKVCILFQLRRLLIYSTLHCVFHCPMLVMRQMILHGAVHYPVRLCSSTSMHAHTT